MLAPNDLRRAMTTKLSVAYFDTGPREAEAVMLLHGWPDDAQGWAEVAGPLAREGWRVIVPYLRGFGPTRFLDASTMRSGDLAALAQDALDLADALGLKRFAIVGHDWGARAAYIVACVAPDRISHCAGFSVGWGTNDPNQILSLRQVQNYWYHWYMALDRGAKLVRNDRRAFTRYIWDDWSVAKPLDEAGFERLAASLDNPDWADVVLHSYRVRWGLAAPDPDYAELAAKVANDPVIKVPTLCIHGGADPCNAPQTSEGKEAFFAGPYRRAVLDGIGHFPQFEAAEATAALIADFLKEGR